MHAFSQLCRKVESSRQAGRGNFEGLYSSKTIQKLVGTRAHYRLKIPVFVYKKTAPEIAA